MGRRPGNSQGGWACLAQDDAGDRIEFPADLVGERLAGRGVRLASVVALAQQCLDARCGCPDQPGGAAVETALLRLARMRPGGSNVAVKIALGPVAEPDV